MKSTYNIANATNQALLQAQIDFQTLTEQFIEEFRRNYQQEEPIKQPPYAP